MHNASADPYTVSVALTRFPNFYSASLHFTKTAISLILTLEVCKLDYDFKISGFLVFLSNPTLSLLSHIPEDINNISKLSNIDISFQSCLLCLT